MSQLLILLSHLTILVQAQERRILPTQYDFPTLGIKAVNGSSGTGGCSSISAPNLDATSTCNTPSSSFLFDDQIPTLTELDGDTWADQLMVMGYPEYGSSSSFQINSYISYASVGRVEVTVFSCPQWRIGVNYIGISYSTSSSRSASYSYIPGVSFSVFSCDSLVRVCIPVSFYARKIRVNFGGYGHTGMHIAEIAFYASSSPCPAFTIVPGNWTAPNATEIDPLFSNADNFTTTDGSSTTHDSLSLSGGLAEGVLEKEFRPILSILSALAAIIALQTAVFFIVGVVATCKYHRQKRVYSVKKQSEEQQPTIPDKEKMEDEDEVYEIMDDEPPLRKGRAHYKKNNAYS